MLALNKLPMLYHKIFDSDKILKINNDGFVVSVPADDPKFDTKSTRDFLESIGGQNLEEI